MLYCQLKEKLLKGGTKNILGYLEGMVEKINERKLLKHQIQKKGKQREINNINEGKSKDIICL